MINEYDRRRFLRITGTGTAAALAGCAAFNPLSDDGDEPDDVLTAAVGPDPEEIEDLIEAVEEGEMDAREAQQREQELIDEATEAFEARVEDDSDLTIEESSGDIGLYQIDGSAEAIVSALREGAVSSLHRAAAYDQFLEQQEQQPQPEPEPEPDEEEGEVDDGEETDDGEEADEADSDEDTDSDDGEDDTGEETEEDDSEDTADGEA
ncbi:MULTISPECIES: hypothetical protein [Natrialbaceae]|uniref:hypothetical protein n=1 Tax=Natrialbaceae TaxID=1644061 RepID=UPI00207D3E0F|nr:hypothetical protein [Natronococcus sp. CG52]